MTQIPFRLTAPALNHEGSITPLAEYIKQTGIDPKHTVNISYALNRLPVDSTALDRERITINFETGEIFTHPRNSTKDDENDSIEPNQALRTTDAVEDEEDDHPATMERLNIKVMFEEFSKCFPKTGCKFEILHTDLLYEGMIPYNYRLLMKTEGHDTLISLEIHSSGSTGVEIHSDDQELINKIINVFTQESIKYRYKVEKGESYIHFICRNDHGYFTHQFEISDGIDFNNIFDNYEDNFKDSFSDPILKKLSDFNYNKGIVLLHGVPGTGKTTYLRYILSKIKKKVMYLPPEMGHAISDPAFITFLMGNPNSILCIEDAENIIKTREAGSNQAVSNILNITDGILGSALKYQVICTFNAEYTEIDSALKRKGRMIGKYEFKELSPHKTKKLVEKLYGEGVKPLKASMTLADIHTMMEDLPSNEVENKKSKFGFAP